MSDLPELGTKGQAHMERVGDILARERVARGISVETIANDLKLNASYIRSIENSDYSKLPGAAYARVYLKSIAVYLGIHAETVLERFSEEQNIDIPDPERERRDTISVRVQGSKPTNPFLPLIYIVVALILISFLIKNGKKEEAEPLENPTDSVNIVVPSDTAELSDDSLPQSILDSSSDSSVAKLPVGDSVPLTDSAKADSVKQESKKRTDSTAAEVKKKSEPKKKMKFTLSGKNDSSWVKLYVDGKKVHDGMVTPKTKLSFVAMDSLNCLVHKNAAVQYGLNGSVFQIEGAGLKILKITQEKIEFWRKSQWKTSFGSE